MLITDPLCEGRHHLNITRGKCPLSSLMLRHPPLGDLVFSSQDVLSVFTKTSASIKPSLECFRCSMLGCPTTSLLHLSTVVTGSVSGGNVDFQLWLFNNKSPDHQVGNIEFTFPLWACNVDAGVTSHYASNFKFRDTSEEGRTEWQCVQNKLFISIFCLLLLFLKIKYSRW